MSAAPTLRCFAFFLVSLTPLGASERGVADDFAKARHEMVAAIEADVAATRFYLDKQTLDARVMHAMATVPRHEFVPVDERRHAYENRPLPIGHGQAISQPYIVAVMTDLLEAKPQHKVLEIGTGSGYQAAVLGALTAQVYTLEIIEPLAQSAIQRLQRYPNVHARVGDGYYGWPEAAPFDAIMVTAAASHVPPPLIAQLKPGGRMVIPIGSTFLVQQLVLVEKGMDGKLTTRQILPVRFVPLTGGH
jgi:protein-L-isoaspartate(D-aspartate) O-methyltransferase